MTVCPLQDQKDQILPTHPEYAIQLLKEQNSSLSSLTPNIKDSLTSFCFIKMSICPYFALMSHKTETSLLLAFTSLLSSSSSTKWLNVNVSICPVCYHHEFKIINNNTGLNTSFCCHPAGWFKNLFNQTAAGECRELSGQAGKLEQKIWPNHTHRHTHIKMSTRALSALSWK